MIAVEKWIMIAVSPRIAVIMAKAKAQPQRKPGVVIIRIVISIVVPWIIKTTEVPAVMRAVVIIFVFVVMSFYNRSIFVFFYFHISRSIIVIFVIADGQLCVAARHH